MKCLQKVPNKIIFTKNGIEFSNRTASKTILYSLNKTNKPFLESFTAVFNRSTKMMSFKSTHLTFNSSCALEIKLALIYFKKLQQNIKFTLGRIIANEYVNTTLLA